MIIWNEKLMPQAKQGLDPNGGSTVMGIHLIFSSNSMTSYCRGRCSYCFKMNKNMQVDAAHFVWGRGLFQGDDYVSEQCFVGVVLF